MKQCEQDSLLARLHQRELRATQDLGDVQAAIEALEKNPEILRVIELVGRVTRRM